MISPQGNSEAVFLEAVSFFYLIKKITFMEISPPPFYKLSLFLVKPFTLLPEQPILTKLEVSFKLFDKSQML